MMAVDLGYTVQPGGYHLILTGYHLQAGTTAVPSKDHPIALVDSSQKWKLATLEILSPPPLEVLRLGDHPFEM